MKKKLPVLLLSSLFFLIPLSNVIGFEHIDNINDGISVYFLVQLDNSEFLELNVTHIEEGNFTLFLFDTRPIESFIRSDKTLDYRIFDIAINYSINDNPYLLHNISESHIYYIQLILIDNGPDTFFLYSNKELTRYYLPIIPGYSTGIIFFSILVSLTLIMFLRRRTFSTLHT